jgi:DNA-binding NarL/FixJ family response regulator
MNITDFITIESDKVECIQFEKTNQQIKVTFQIKRTEKKIHYDIFIQDDSEKILITYYDEKTEKSDENFIHHLHQVVKEKIVTHPNYRLYAVTSNDFLAMEENPYMKLLDESLSAKEKIVFEMYKNGASYGEIANSLNAGNNSKVVDNAIQRIKRKISKGMNGN